MSKSTNVRTPGIASIAKKWNLSLAKVIQLVNQGAKVEKEHNTSLVKAKEVARDHIAERPDYYHKLKKMEKSTVSMKEEIGTGGVRGLGYVSGDPAGMISGVDQYINTNVMSYEDMNGAILKLIRDKHSNFHNNMGFTPYTPNDIQNNLKEGISAGPEREYDYSIGDAGGGRTILRKSEVKEGKVLDKIKKSAKVGALVGALGAHGGKIYDVGNVATHHDDPGLAAATVVANLHPASRVANAMTTALKADKAGKGENEFARQKKYGKKIVTKEDVFNEDLRKWFREKWVRYDTKGNIKGPCAREEGEGKPKCRPLASARAMSKDERAKSARRKRREDPVADRPGKGGKPIMVNTNEETLLEKNVPTNPALWARAKAQAKAKFDVYPSAYANGWASKWYKSKGGGWKAAANESVDEACWDNYKQEGMKKKGNKMVPNCVPVEEEQLNELKPETLGSYVMKAASSRRKALEGPKADIKTWGKRQKGITTAIKKLTKEDEYVRPYDSPSVGRTNKPDVALNPGAGGRTYVREETKMDTKEIINEAIENIVENNLSDMKENFQAALQEKVNEKLEERKKVIAANYFAQ